jgi:hypothetical protein
MIDFKSSGVYAIPVVVCCSDPNVDTGLRTKQSRANWEQAFQQHYLQLILNVSDSALLV